MPSLAKAIFKAGVKESVTHGPKPAILRTEIDGFGGLVPKDLPKKNLHAFVKKDRAASYHIDPEMAMQVDAPAGYRKVKKGEKYYLVRRDIMKKMEKEGSAKFGSISGAGDY